MSQRYQKEIEEILSRVGKLPPSEGQAKKSHKMHQEEVVSSPGRWKRSTRQQRLLLSPGRLMLIGVALLIAAVVLRTTASGIVAPVAWAGVALFISAYILFFVRPRPTTEKRWRGRPLETPIEHRHLWKRLQRWLGLQ